MNRTTVTAVALLTALAGAAAWHLCCNRPQPQPQPANPSYGSGPPERVAASVERLRARLRRPDTLRVLSVVNPPARVATVEVRFEAAGEDGATARSRFWVRWTEEGPVDGLPEDRQGAVDDPAGLFR